MTTSVPGHPQQGYLEGYYGRLLDWSERQSLLQQIGELSLNTYFYAPKEDIHHRLQWRTDYPAHWRNAFGAFCQQARAENVRLVAGVAPGLDFDFADLPNGQDYQLLLAKLTQLLSDGADTLALLLDDIDEDFAARRGSFTQEGTAHATLANRLSKDLTHPLWVVPRIYANELAVDAPDYLPHFIEALDADNAVVYCGSHVVAPVIDRDDGYNGLRSSHEIIFWDNLYANDYCPRRLFVGPWTGRREHHNVLLNPTGMPATDRLLLTLMSKTIAGTEPTVAWTAAMKAHGVPDSFLSLASFFDKPCWPVEYHPAAAFGTDEQFDALDTLLWRWKSPLAREWYPYLMSLKHDLLLASGALPEDRMIKTQPNPLVSRLIR